MPAKGVEIAGVERAYGDLVALRGMGLRVGPGEIVAVVGPSGCGKSTLLELVCGLQRPDAGRVSSDPAVLMPQRDLLLPWSSALDNAALPLLVRGASPAAARARARPLFAQLGLEGFEGARPYELSGGMRQRVAFLRTLLAGKPVLLLDEPFASLDAITRAEMQEWLAAALGEEAGTCILVTHDVEEALYLCDRVVVLSARPARPVAELRSEGPRAVDRTSAVTEPGFTARRERALEALRGAP